jgi:FdrA protein
MDRIDVRKDTYFDSVFLMAASAELARIEGLEAGHLVLATEQNRALLQAQSFDPAPFASLGPTDLVIALRAAEPEVIDAALERVELLLQRARPETDDGTREAPVGLDGGLARLPDANLALISVPGAYAALEAHKALTRGLNVMLFSNNVSLEDEIALKRRAAELGLLVMGPDCGTAMIGGTPLGFANRVRRGPVGLVGASGTGLQEVACQLHRIGSGVTHILGTGGRDLKAGVGARTTLAALDVLSADPDTRVVVVVSKPPAREVADLVLRRLRQLDRPSVVCFLGQDLGEDDEENQLHHARTLAEAAWVARRLARNEPVAVTQPYEIVRLDETLLIGTMSERQRHLIGLYTGGTLAGEALLTLRRELGDERVSSNLSPPEPGARGHTVLDLGADEYTRGRPHPMIDPAPRNEQIRERGSDPETALLLLDVVLGHGSHPDPAGEAARAVADARRGNRSLAVVGSITGTDLDPQNLRLQEQVLEDAGVQVLPNNAAAASFAARLILALEEARR